MLGLIKSNVHSKYLLYYVATCNELLFCRLLLPRNRNILFWWRSRRI